MSRRGVARHVSSHQWVPPYREIAPPARGCWVIRSCKGAFCLVETGSIAVAWASAAVDGGQPVIFGHGWGLRTPKGGTTAEGNQDTVLLSEASTDACQLEGKRRETGALTLRWATLTWDGVSVPPRSGRPQELTAGAIFLRWIASDSIGPAGSSRGSCEYRTTVTVSAAGKPLLVQTSKTPLGWQPAGYAWITMAL